MSTLRTTKIQHPSSPAENITLKADGSVELPETGLEDLGNVSGTPSAGDKLVFDGSDWVPASPSGNAIINGAMEVAQRGTSFTLTDGAGQYVLDRWVVATFGGSGTVSRVAGSNGFRYAMRVTGASGVTAWFVSQKIESRNMSALTGNRVTYSVTLSSSTLTSISWFARRPDADDNYAAVTDIDNGTLTITSTPTRYSFSFDVPTDATTGLEVFFLGGAFSSGTFDITGVQLEVGPVATPFQFEDFGTTLAKCQRYYEKSYRLENPPGTNTTNGSVWSSGTSNQNSDVTLSIRMTVPKRAVPSVTLFHQDGTPGSWRYSRSGFINQSATPVADLGSQFGFRVYVPIGATFTAATIDGHWVASAEL